METVPVTETVEDQLEKLRIDFMKGDKSVLFAAICLVLRSQPAGSSWVTDAAMEIEATLGTRRCPDMNAAFGWTTDRKKQLGVRQRQEKNKEKILSMLVAYRLSGGSLNTELAFKSIADEIGIPWRDVEAVYKRHGRFIKALPQVPIFIEGKKVEFGYGDATLPSFTLSATCE